jgi:hypothetical protein
MRLWHGTMQRRSSKVLVDTCAATALWLSTTTLRNHTARAALALSAHLYIMQALLLQHFSDNTCCTTAAATSAEADRERSRGELIRCVSGLRSITHCQWR